MNTLFSEQEWNGEFFLPDHDENMFFGKVTFSPGAGLMLSYRVLDIKTIPDSNLVYGILETGQKCTLIGQFSQIRSGQRIVNGLSSITGKNEFDFLILDEFVNEDEKYSEVMFSVTGMQEFFFPGGNKDLIKYSDKPLIQVATDFGQISVRMNAIFSRLGKDITSQIYNRNETALLELQNAFKEINNRHSDSYFMLKKDIASVFILKTKVESTIYELYKHIMDISNLFAILLYSPVYPQKIELIYRADTEYLSENVVIPSLHLEAGTIGLCKQERSHFSLPITHSKIDLSTIISNWLRDPKQFSTIVSNIQHKTGFKDEHSLHGDLVLYATQLESISFSQKVKKRKYEYPVNEYGSEKVQAKLNEIFLGAGVKKLGEGIGDLRNEIAHVKRRKDLLSKLTMRNLLEISVILRLTILGFVLDSLGVDKKVISDYQDKHTP